MADGYRNRVPLCGPLWLRMEFTSLQSDRMSVAVSMLASFVVFIWSSNLKGKERKGKEEYLYSAFLHQGTHKALRHGSHSITCKQHRG